MIYGLGTDIIDVKRVKRQVESHDDFKYSILTQDEVDYCMSKASWAQLIAGRFAAKEAFFKALGTGWRNGMKFTDIEVLNDHLGKPHIKLYNKTKEFYDQNQLTTIHVSISHLKDLANAVVVIEK